MVRKSQNAMSGMLLHSKLKKKSLRDIMANGFPTQNGMRNAYDGKNALHTSEMGADQKFRHINVTSTLASE